jgi:hypothetical protein
MVVIFYDLDDKNMSLSVLKTWLKNHVPLYSFIKKESMGLAIFVQLAPYFNHK